MTRIKIHFPVLALLLVFLSGCEDIDADKISAIVDDFLKCQTNATQECQCIDGSFGVQTCGEESGSWDECICLGSPTDDCTPTAEICDGEDNDCDGMTDEDSSDAPVWYKDQDGDGFGIGISIRNCSPLGAFSAKLSGDCDDTNENIYPNRAEACDGIDNDCDGSIDENLIVNYYTDQDGDGYGAGDLQTGCIDDVDPLYTAELSGDCDDTSAVIHPHAEELECDTVDSNCDGSTGNATWLDTATGICWQKEPISTTTTTDAAIAYCRGLSLGDKKDWILPNIDELRSLVKGCPTNEEYGSCRVTSLTPSDNNGAACQACNNLQGPAKSGCYWPEGLGGTCQSEYLSDTQNADNITWRVRYSDARIRAVDLAQRGLVRCMTYPELPRGLNLLPNSRNLQAWDGSQNSATFNVVPSPEPSPLDTNDVYLMEDKRSDVRTAKIATAHGEFAIGDSYTFSIWLKSTDEQPPVARLYIGEILQTDRVYHSQTFAVTNAWRRYVFKATLVGIGARKPLGLLARIEPAGASAGDTGSLLAWGPQLEKGSSATAYQQTGVNLIAESRNLNPQTTGWSGKAKTQIARELSPNGTQGVFRAIDDDDTNYLYLSYAIYNRGLWQIGDQLTFSVWLKSDGPSPETARVNILEKVDDSGTYNQNPVECELLGAWSRCFTTLVVQRKDGNAQNEIRVYISPTRAVGRETGSFLIYGPQLEKNEIPTAFQPTGSLPNLLADGNMEEIGCVAPNCSPWNQYWDRGALSKSQENPHGGQQALRIEQDNAAHSWGLAYQDALLPSSRYRFTGWARSSAEVLPDVRMGLQSIHTFEEGLFGNWRYVDLTFDTEGSAETALVIGARNLLVAHSDFVEWDDVALVQIDSFTERARAARQFNIRNAYCREETCDGIDNDCDGLIDENPVDASIWYLDQDGDGFGTNIYTVSCERPDDTTVSRGGDCDDSAVEVNPGATETCNDIDDDCDGSTDEEAFDAVVWYLDQDADQFGTTDFILGCEALGSYTARNALDCDDSRGGIHPSALEYCNDLDDDCDGSTDENAEDATDWHLDQDEDSFGTTDVITGCGPQGFYTATNDQDCDDSAANVNPDALEYCNDVDDNCDGNTDNNAVDAKQYYLDQDRDSFGATPIKACHKQDKMVENGQDCHDLNANIFPGAPETCNNVDDDCDGSTDENAIDATAWYFDQDGDGFGTSAYTNSCRSQGLYTALRNQDCDDSNADIHPTAEETECDGIDNNCDGQTDPETYFDTTSGICWQKSQIESGPTIDELNNYCDELVIGNMDDWALPNIDELRSLVRGCGATLTGDICPVTSLTTMAGNTGDCTGCPPHGGPGDDGCFLPPELEGSCLDDFISSSALTDGHWAVNYGDAAIHAVANTNGTNFRCMRQEEIPSGVNLLPNSALMITWQDVYSSCKPRSATTSTVAPPLGQGKVMEITDDDESCFFGKAAVIPGQYKIGDTYTFSLWLRSGDGEPHTARLFLQSMNNNTIYASPNTEVIVDGTWRRFEHSTAITADPAGQPPSALRVDIVPMCPSGGGDAVCATETGSVLLYGPQLERGTTATDYHETWGNLIFNSRDLSRWDGDAIIEFQPQEISPINTPGIFRVEGKRSDTSIESLTFEVNVGGVLDVGDSVTFSVWLSAAAEANLPSLIGKILARVKSGSRTFINRSLLICELQDSTWKRCSRTFEIEQDDFGKLPNILEIEIYAFDASYETPLFVFGPQLEIGTIATPYQPTGNFPNYLQDGDMESTENNFWFFDENTTWTGKQTDTPHGGAQVLRLFNNGGSALAHQEVLVNGRSYRLSGYARSDTNSAPGLWDTNWLWIGENNSSEWQYFHIPFEANSDFIKLHHATSGAGQYTDWDDLYLSPARDLLSWRREVRQSHERALYPNGGNY